MPVDRWQTGCSNGWAFTTPFLPSPHGWRRVPVGGICIDMFYPVDRWNELGGDIDDFSIGPLAKLLSNGSVLQIR
jgi:hypothetical protein